MLDRVVRDALGRDINFSLVPERVISLIPSITESLFDLGLGNRIVGVSQFCTYPEHLVLEKPRVGGQKNPNHDAIASLNPDLIILNQEENRKEDIERFSSRYRTFVTFPRRFADSAELLRDLSRIFDVPLMTEPYIRTISAHSRRPQASIRTLYLIWRKPWMSINHDTYIHDVMRVFGFDNVCAGMEKRYPELTEAEIARLNPECIILPDEPFRFRERHREEILTWPVSACHDDRVVLVDGTYFCWYGTRAARTEDYLTRQIWNRLKVSA